ncbi:MAG TPA: hypothetical protein VFH51_07060, partial [Myxococcota bacterium]|nr:hypothetical protein [Myxococcota bacterium]
MIHIYTSAALNYISKVAVLVRSVRRHHPEAVVHLLVCERRRVVRRDHVEALEALGAELVWADEIAPATDPGWLFRHDVVELATAMKGPL